MMKVGVPVVPGSAELIKDHSEGKKIAKKIGYPVIIKATAGGGGKGIRIVKNDKDFEKVFDIARTEAKSSFSNDGIYVEKLIEEPRHIEIQVAGDQYGNVIHMSERDCSIPEGVLAGCC